MGGQVKSATAAEFQKSANRIKAIIPNYTRSYIARVSIRSKRLIMKHDPDEGRIQIRDKNAKKLG